MSGRSRAHPWWHEPLPPFDASQWFGDGSISITIKVEPVCANCGEGFYGGHYAMRMEGWISPFLCKRPRHATKEGVVWKERQ